MLVDDFLIKVPGKRRTDYGSKGYIYISFQGRTHIINTFQARSSVLFKTCQIVNR